MVLYQRDNNIFLLKWQVLLDLWDLKNSSAELVSSLLESINTRLKTSGGGMELYKIFLKVFFSLKYIKKQYSTLSNS